jgi:C1A family cysteine protease
LYLFAGYVTPVKSQGSCSCCTAFANMAIIESCYKKLTGLTINLSEQQFVDCARGYQQANGCKGHRDR